VKEFQVGMLIPWVNTAMEEEIPFLVNPNVGLHWSRLRPKKLPRNGHDTSYLKDMALSIPEALSRFGGLDIHVIIMGCTSISFTGSTSTINIPIKYKHIKTITTFEAIILQIQKIKAKRVQLFAPYDEGTIAREIDLLKSYGFEVIKSVSLPYSDEIRYISMEQIYNTFIKEYTPKCDTVLFSCTALFTLDLINHIKEYFKIETPILSSNIAISHTLNDLYCRKFQHKKK